MAILAAARGALNDIVGDAVAFVEEFDLLSGQFTTVYESVSGSPGKEAVPVVLGEMTIARFTPTVNTNVNNEAIAMSLSLLYQRNWTSILLSATLRPLDFSLTSHDYYDDIAGRLLQSMFARYVIIRQRTTEETGDDYLYCAGIRDRFDQLTPDVRVYDLAKSTPSSEIYRAMEERFKVDRKYVNFLYRRDHASVFDSRSMSGFEEIKTIVVCPLTVGDKVTGFINVGYDFELSINPYLEDMLASGFNHMAIAMENFRSTNDLSELKFKQFTDYAARYHVDLLQGFRHAAVTALDKTQYDLRKIDKYYVYKGEPKENPRPALDKHLDEIQAAINGMKDVREFSDEKEIADLVQVFEEARGQWKVDLDNAEMTVRVNNQAGRAEAFINVDAVRSAFGNLILNAVQASRDANIRKTDRKITVSFSRSRDGYVVDFADEGPGIRLGQDIREIDDIWRPGKTSKKGGTGYGLPMVRLVFQSLHQGSVNLRKSPRGAHFRIELSDGLEELSRGSGSRGAK